QTYDSGPPRTWSGVTAIEVSECLGADLRGCSTLTSLSIQYGAMGCVDLRGLSRLETLSLKYGSYGAVLLDGCDALTDLYIEDMGESRPTKPDIRLSGFPLLETATLTILNPSPLVLMN